MGQGADVLFSYMRANAAVEAHNEVRMQFYDAALNSSNTAVTFDWHGSQQRLQAEAAALEEILNDLTTTKFSPPHTVDLLRNFITLLAESLRKFEHILSQLEKTKLGKARYTESEYNSDYSEYEQLVSRHNAVGKELTESLVRNGYMLVAGTK